MDRPVTPAIFQANLLLVGAVVLGLLVATVLGATLGASEFVPLYLICAATTAIFFAVGLYRFTWHIALFLLFFGFSYRPFGFSFGALELSCGLGGTVIALFVWQKRLWGGPPAGTERTLRFLRSALLIWLVYVAIHVIYNIEDPQRPSEFSFNNAIKSYFGVSAPLALLFYFARSPAGIVVRKDFFWTIAKLCLVGLVVNVGIRFYELAGGHYVWIPVINALSGGYTLRTLGPMAMLIGAVGITASGGRKTLPRFLIYWSLLLLGALGAVVSGGRASVILGLVCVGAVLVMRRKVLALALVAMFGLLGIAAANASEDWINRKADPIISRSLQWTLLHKKGAATADIESSTDWRTELFHRALAEWKSDPRIFWFGRATYGFGTADDTAIFIAGGYEALIQSSLRRGATHNLITDLLVAYGVIGLTLYALVCAAIFQFAWTLQKTRNLSSPAANLVLVTLVGSVIWLIYAVLGGSFYPTEYVWFLLILLGAFNSGLGVEERRRTAIAERDPVPAYREAIHLPGSARRLVQARRR